jgi:hypothetical protein
LQITISGFTQTNTPPIITTPCGTEACTDLNMTLPLTYTGFPGIAWTPNDAALDAALVVAAGTNPCSFTFSVTVFCSTTAPDTDVTYEVFVTIYAKDGGGVGVYIGYKYEESNTGEGYNGCTTWYEALGTIEATGTTTDCAALSESLTLSTKTAGCTGGTPPVWCDGTIAALLEPAP